MATITLLSAKGSPGVTTTTVALALAWSAATNGHRVLAVDADPVGGDTAAGVLRASLDAPAGMLSLAAARGADPAEAVDASAVPLSEDGAARLLPGIPDGARSRALPLAWDVLTAAAPTLRDQGIDLLVDAGRVDGAHPWITGADVLVLVVRPTLPAVAAARRLVGAWPNAASALHVLVVESPATYTSAEVAAALGLPLVGAIDFDPRAATVHSEGAAPPRGFERSGYARSIRRVAAALARLAVDQPGVTAHSGVVDVRG